MGKRVDIGQLTKTISALIKLSTEIGDVFFSKKLSAHAEKILRAYVEEEDLVQEGNHSVAQYNTSRKDLFATITGCFEFIDDLLHLRLASPLSLLTVQRSLLMLAVMAKEQRPEQDTEKNSGSAVLSGKQNRTKNIPREARLSRSQEKIIHFIKQSSTARTKDIIDEFSDLSERTVKRNLKELINKGFVRRQVENQAVYYQTIDER